MRDAASVEDSLKEAEICDRCVSLTWFSNDVTWRGRTSRGRTSRTRPVGYWYLNPAAGPNSPTFRTGQLDSGLRP